MAPLRSSCSTLDCRARAQPSSFPEEEALHTRREEGEEVQEGRIITASKAIYQDQTCQAPWQSQATQSLQPLASILVSHPMASPTLALMFLDSRCTANLDR